MTKKSEDLVKNFQKTVQTLNNLLEQLENDQIHVTMTIGAKNINGDWTKNYRLDINKITQYIDYYLEPKKL